MPQSWTIPNPIKRAERIVQLVDLTLGRMIAVLVGVAGALVLSIAIDARDFEDALLPLAIGLGLLAIAAAMLYWRITFLKVFEFMAGYGSSS